MDPEDRQASPAENAKQCLARLDDFAKKHEAGLSLLVAIVIVAITTAQVLFLYQQNEVMKQQSLFVEQQNRFLKGQNDLLDQQTSAQRAQATRAILDSLAPGDEEDAWGMALMQFRAYGAEGVETLLRLAELPDSSGTPVYLPGDDSPKQRARRALLSNRASLSDEQQARLIVSIVKDFGKSAETDILVHKHLWYYVIEDDTKAKSVSRHLPSDFYSIISPYYAQIAKDSRVIWMDEDHFENFGLSGPDADSLLTALCNEVSGLNAPSLLLYLRARLGFHAGYDSSGKAKPISTPEDAPRKPLHVRVREMLRQVCYPR